MYLTRRGRPVPGLGLGPLAAYLHPVGQLVQLGGEGSQLVGDGDLPGYTDGGAGAAAQTGVRPLVPGHRVQLHLDRAAAAGAQLVVLVQQIGDVQLLRAAVAAVAAGGAGDGILQYLVRRGEEDGLLSGERGSGFSKVAMLSCIWAMLDIPERIMPICSSPWQPAEAEGGDAGVGPRAWSCRSAPGIQRGQLAAPDRLHHQHRDVLLASS